MNARAATGALGTAGHAGSRARSAIPLRWQALWQQRSGSERRLIGVAVGAVGLLVLWHTGLGSSLSTLRTAEAQHDRLNAQLTAQRRLATETLALRAVPLLGAEDRRRALDAAVKQHLGATAQLAVTDARATVGIRNVPGDALARWLIQTRTEARAVPVEAQLSLNAARTGWEGSVVLALAPP